MRFNKTPVFIVLSSLSLANFSLVVTLRPVLAQDESSETSTQTATTSDPADDASPDRQTKEESKKSPESEESKKAKDKERSDKVQDAFEDDGAKQSSIKEVSEKQDSPDVQGTKARDEQAEPQTQQHPQDNVEKTKQHNDVEEDSPALDATPTNKAEIEPGPSPMANKDEEDKPDPDPDLTEVGDVHSDAASGKNHSEDDTHTLVNQPIPVQEPVPPMNHKPRMMHWERSQRWLNAGEDLMEQVARDAPMTYLPVWGGRANEAVSHGASGPFNRGLGIELDGVAIDIPMAGRGSHYADMSLIPLAAIGSYRVLAGMGSGGYASTIRLKTRKLEGVEAGLRLGERGQRQLLAAGGYSSGHSRGLLALQTDSATGLKTGSAHDTWSVLGRLHFDLAKNLRASVGARSYRSRWDDLGAVELDNGTPIGYLGGASDGGQLAGEVVDAAVHWHPDPKLKVSANLSFMDDSYATFATKDAVQEESRDHNRVGTMSFAAKAYPGEGVFTSAGLKADIRYDASSHEAFGTNGRQRAYTLRQLDGDWTRTRLLGDLKLRFSESIILCADGGIVQFNIREKNIDSSDAPSIYTHSFPLYSLRLKYKPGAWGLEWGLNRSHVTGPSSFGELSFGEGAAEQPKVREGDSAYMGFNLDLFLNEWRLTTRLEAYASMLGRPFLGSTTYADDIWVVGGHLHMNATHAPSGLQLVASGGPAISRGAHESTNSKWAPGVPAYDVHVGILRMANKGVLLNFWVDAFGNYIRKESDSNFLGGAQQNVSVKVGYRISNLNFWLGANNLLNAPVAESFDPVIRRSERRFFAIVEWSPSSKS
jgi:hypothetical protein